MQVLIIGSGGREHALGWKLAQSPLLDQLYFAPGNPGTAGLGTNVELADHAAVVAFAREHQIGLVVVGPEQPLVDGIVDTLTEAGISCFGPSRAAAQLEGSKSFAKSIMAAAGVPTAAHRSFTLLDEALAFAQSQPHPLVVKADGLAAGKGVSICRDFAESAAAIRAMMSESRFGAAGETLVIEEFLSGTEVSFHVICDGRDYWPLVSAQDHKPLLDGNRGPNTGGMGTFAPSPLVTPALAHRLGEEICAPVIEQLRTRGIAYRGVLYAGLMLTPAGPYVLEFNCRFGDPETQVIMPLLDFDLLPVLLGAAQGQLPAFTGGWRDQAAVCVVLAAAGYPESARKGDIISGIEAAPDAQVFQAATTINPAGDLVTNGGRVLGVTAWAGNHALARKKAYDLVRRIHFTGKQFRSDIGGTNGPA